MASSMSSHRSSDSEETKAVKDKMDWERSTWNSEHVTKIIASSAEMIKITGSKPDKDGKIFSASVHRGLLCFFSPYYTAALCGGFAEAQKSTITMNLPYDRLADLVSWLYSGITIAVEPDELFELYAFADEKMMLAFRRSIMTRLIEFNDPGQMEEDAMSYVKRLPENCGLFRYLVDYWVGVWAQLPSRSAMEALDADGRIPRKFFYQALEKFVSLSEKKNRNDYWHPENHRACLGIACNYHEHVNTYEWSETCDMNPRHAGAHSCPMDAYYIEQ